MGVIRRSAVVRYRRAVVRVAGGPLLCLGRVKTCFCLLACPLELTHACGARGALSIGPGLAQVIPLAGVPSLCSQIVEVAGGHGLAPTVLRLNAIGAPIFTSRSRSMALRPARQPVRPTPSDGTFEPRLRGNRCMASHERCSAGSGERGACYSISGGSSREAFMCSDSAVAAARSAASRCCSSSPSASAAA